MYPIRNLCTVCCTVTGNAFKVTSTSTCRLLPKHILYTQVNRPSTKLTLRCQRHYSNSLADAELKYVPRRTLIYVPGHDLNKLRKIPGLEVDCAVMECEDGVALNKKEEARENIRLMLDELGEVKGKDLAVRINSVSSGLVEEDLTVIMAAARPPPTILLPKADTVENIITFTNYLRTAVSERHVKYCPNLITYAESAQGVLNLQNILQTAADFCQLGIYHLDGVVFGSDDYCADIGAERTLDALEVLYARQKVVMVAKAFRIQAIDMVYIDYKDLKGLEEQSLQGARMGYTGKQVIHPGQLPVVNKAFTPTSDKVKWATELVQAFEQHQINGKGAFTFRGLMVDRPLLLQARNILKTVQNVQHKDGSQQSHN